MTKKMTLGSRLICGFALVLIMFAAVMGIYQYTLSHTTQSFQNLMKLDVAIADHASAVDSMMLQSRGNEKDFLARLGKKYIERLEKNIDSLKKEALAIIALAEKAKNKGTAEKAKAVIGHAETYLKNFKGIVEAHEMKGLDDKSGLQGKFGSAADTLAEMLPGHEVSDLVIALLQVRQHEKEYVRTKAERHRKVFQSAVDAYINLLAKSRCQADAKKIQEKALVSYQETFKGYLKALASLDQDIVEESYQTMKSDADDMENALAGVYIP
ncbi:MAG: hypothetical protein ABII06_16305, partial [Pseudomonadota bacterium]